MTSLLRRKRRTTVPAPSISATKAASLAVLGLLLCGGFASAQTLPGKPVSSPILPAVHTKPAGMAEPIQQVSSQLPGERVSMQRTAFQGRQGDVDESTSFEVPTELPSDQRVFGRLESEEQWRQRVTQLEADGGKPRPIFPQYAMLSKEKYFGRQWPEQDLRVEPNYAVYGRVYFEQKNFDRYGWDLGPIAPVVESLVFGKDVALLPYHIATDPFRCYESNAGYCLPGDPVPLLLYPPNLNATGALAEAGVIATLIAAFP